MSLMASGNDITLAIKKKKSSLIQTFLGTHGLPEIDLFSIYRTQLRKFCTGTLSI